MAQLPYAFSGGVCEKIIVFLSLLGISDLKTVM